MDKLTREMEQTTRSIKEAFQREVGLEIIDAYKCRLSHYWTVETETSSFIWDDERQKFVHASGY